MKKNLLMLTFAVMAIAGSAQKFQLGLKAGVNLASPSGGAVTSKEGKAGLHAGAFATIGALGISVQPEIAFHQINYTLNGNSVKQNYMVIPVMLKFNIPLSGLGLMAGPQWGTVLSAKSNGTDIKSQLKPTDLAAVFGADFRIPLTKLVIAARYQAGLTDITEASGTVRNNATTLTLGWRL